MVASVTGGVSTPGRFELVLGVGSAYSHALVPAGVEAFVAALFVPEGTLSGAFVCPSNVKAAAGKLNRMLTSFIVSEGWWIGFISSNTRLFAVH